MLLGRAGEGKGAARRLFLFLSLAGICLVTLEAVLTLRHTSLCSTEGCRIAFAHTRFGEMPLFILADAAFALLGFLALRGFGHGLIDAVLTACLSAEGLLMGYEFLEARKLCAFCVAVFLIFLGLVFVRMLSGERQAGIGLICFFSVMLISYLVKPAAVPSLKGNLVLIYSPTCSHCLSVEEACKRYGIKVREVPVNSCEDILEALCINRVPVLFVNKPGEKRFLIGEGKIKEYLLASRFSFFRLGLFDDTSAQSCPIGKKCR